MKKTLTILFVLVSFLGYSQSTMPQFLGGKTTNLIVQGILNLADSSKASFNWVLADTATTKTYFSSNLKGRWARQSGRLYYNPSGLKFVVADSVTSSGGTAIVDSNVFVTVTRLSDSTAVLRSLITSPTFDTTEIYNQLALRVKYTDTGLMLSSYLNTADIGVSVQGYDANTTILGNTTSGSGSTILRQGSPTITLPSIAAINVMGGILSLPTGASGTLMRLSDTSTLSNRINAKLNISDTANIRLRPIAGTNVTITGTYPNLTFNSSAGGSGTVTSVATNNGTGITGGTITTTGTLAIDTSNTISTKLYRKKGDDSVAAIALTKQPQLSGTGFVKASGTTISYDNSTYLTTSTAASTYAPIATTVTLTGSQTITNKTLTSPIINTPRLGTSSTTGYVWTASDGLGNGSWAAAGGGGGSYWEFGTTGNVISSDQIFGSTVGSAGTYNIDFRLKDEILMRLGRKATGERFGYFMSRGTNVNNYDSWWIGGEANSATGIRAGGINGVGGTSTGTGSLSINGGQAQANNAIAAMSTSTYANGDNSTAWGGYANNNNFTGCFNISDFSETSFSNNTVNNQFAAKYAGGFLFKTAAATTRMTIKASGIVNISNTPTYADNTAALAGGLVAGDIYRTATGVLMITY